MALYRAPFPTPESRRPTWRFPNELPIAGEPADVYATMSHAHAALAASTYPKLLFAAEPGALVPLGFAEELAGKLHDCRFVKLGDASTISRKIIPRRSADPSRPSSPKWRVVRAGRRRSAGSSGGRGTPLSYGRGVGGEGSLRCRRSLVRRAGVRPEGRAPYGPPLSPGRRRSVKPIAIGLRV